MNHSRINAVGLSFVILRFTKLVSENVTKLSTKERYCLSFNFFVVYLSFVSTQVCSYKSLNEAGFDQKMHHTKKIHESYQTFMYLV